ncbi:hypothetical protein GKG47_19600 [Lactonifactor sp. BIOML-A3]|nr:hypothetical protein [Lactonifactor sp. BIOML-A5]MSA10118.1 hypothetical protein [Lactonifactor sp. BIOML-A4]MSA14624.1 hypothetical protein [Lactonifactor sp. BIOML-A3]MSA19046.1 hypothetical protein [Lactonifactor sp. BIOML-A2]MSA39764.1 hypothetical protein [Lactonifactor sp. BIOML-A1]MSB15555.1 hypothetical protein [Lactonifactor sp. BIOML-A6]MSB71037.1 hypothetical protein [Lactonifactor sp. BIOML-A7]
MSRKPFGIWRQISAGFWSGKKSGRTKSLENPKDSPGFLSCRNRDSPELLDLRRGLCYNENCLFSRMDD